MFIPNRGEAFVGGISVQRHRARALAKVGAIFEAPRFYDYLSGWRNLEIFTSYSAIVPQGGDGGSRGVRRAEKRIHDKVGTYSQGMRQRLGLAQALLPAPDVVLLDEPTNGLDPEGIAEMRELIQRLNRERRITVLFCSHLLSEVEQLCDRVAILNQGRMLYQGRWHELAPKGSRFRIDAEPWDEARSLSEWRRARARDAAPGHRASAGPDVADLVDRLVGAGVKVRADRARAANPGAALPRASAKTMTLFFRQFRAELAKLFARKRTWMGFGAFFALEIVILRLQTGDGPAGFFSATSSGTGRNGGAVRGILRRTTMAFLIVALTIFLSGSFPRARGRRYREQGGGGRHAAHVPVPAGEPLATARSEIPHVLGLYLCPCCFIGLTALATAASLRGLGNLFAFIPQHQLLIALPEAEALFLAIWPRCFGMG